MNDRGIFNFVGEFIRELKYPWVVGQLRMYPKIYLSEIWDSINLLTHKNNNKIKCNYRD